MELNRYDMQLKLIELDTAELAIECGFDWFPLKVYRNTLSTLCSQALVQMWLRNVHRINITVRCNKSYGENIKYMFTVESDTDYPDTLIYVIPKQPCKTVMDSYEECLEGALIIALNRIKEIKTLTDTN